MASAIASNGTTKLNKRLIMAISVLQSTAIIVEIWKQDLRGLPFTNKPERHSEWIVGCRRADATPSKHAFVCSQHFTEDVIDRTGQITGWSSPNNC